MQQEELTPIPGSDSELPPPLMEESVHAPLWPSLGWKWHGPIIAGLLIIVSITFANSYKSGMTLDNRYIIDEYYKAITHNIPNQSLESWDQVKLLFSYDYWWPKGISGLYRPITSLSYWVDYVLLTGKAQKTDFHGEPMKDGKGQVIPPEAYERMSWQEYSWAPGQLNANSYHTINLLLHWANAVLIYLISLALIKKVWPAIFAAALFATHPITTESVTNIIGRADIFAALSTFGGLLLYMRSTRSVGIYRLPWLIGLMFVCLFGFFCKESAVAIGAIIPAYWLIFEFDWKKPDWLEKLLWELLAWCIMLLPLGMMIGARIRVFAPPSTPAEEPFLDNPIRGIWQVKALGIPEFEQQLQSHPLLGVSYIECKMTAVKIMGKLLTLVAWPWTLCSDYSYDQIPNFSWGFQHGWEDWQAVFWLFALLGIAGATVWLYLREHRVAAFFIVFFFLASLPTSNFIVTIGSVMAERFMYLPLMGFTGILALAAFWVGEWLWTRFKLIDRSDIPGYSIIVAEVLGLVVLVYGARAFVRNYVWESDITLWEDAIKTSPRSFRCYQSLAFAYWEQDQSLLSLDKCIDIDRGALPIVRTLPNHLNSSRLYLHLGIFCLSKGDTILSQAPKAPNGDVVIPQQAVQSYIDAVKYLEEGSDVDRSFNQINRAKQIRRGDRPEKITDVGLAPIYSTLGKAYMRLHYYDDAFKRFMYEMHMDPKDPDAYVNLATLKSEIKQYEDSAVLMIQAILLDPFNGNYWNALVQVYASMGVQNGVILENGQPRLNIVDPNSPSRRLLGYAYRDFIRAFLQAHRYAEAEDARTGAVTKYGLPAAMFDPLFQERMDLITPHGSEKAPIEDSPAADIK